MPDQSKLDNLFMDIAERVGQESHDEQFKVGSVIVKDGNILSMGYNGTISGSSNITRYPDGVTRPEVIHSEANAFMKLAKHGGNCNGATIYCTYSPCWGCTKLILQAGIIRLVYNHVYDEESLLFIKGRIEHARVRTHYGVLT
jgi:dCMP deaminase